MSNEENDQIITADANEEEPCQSTLDLQKCLKDIVQNALRNVTDDEFIQIYKNCYKAFEKKSEVETPALGGSSMEAKKYQSQLNSMIQKPIFSAVDQTVLGINRRLKELEEMKETQKDSTVYWRPPGDATEHMMAFQYICEAEKKKDLETRIRIEQENISRLKTRLSRKRLKAEECYQKLQKVKFDIQNSVTV